MTLHLEHRTHYTYPAPVFLEPHVFRFRPRQSAHLRLVDYELSIDAPLAGRRRYADAEGNEVDFAWFGALGGGLRLVACATIEVLMYNPLDFVLYPTAFGHLPASYAPLQRRALEACLAPLALDDELVAYADEVFREVQSDTIQFVTALTRRLHADFGVVYRELGEPRVPARTMALREGSCRDLSWLLIGLLRHHGLAARFTSGYLYFEMDAPAYELHAWVEVFLPGCGWLGLDPSHGMVAGHTHVPVAASHHYDNTMPVTGTVRGEGPGTMATELRITTG